jgi:inorganic pyrophosphatase
METPDPYFRWRPHPWHGLEVGPHPPELVHAYIEISPFDLVKYEVDKVTGYLRIDRPQRTSSQPPTLYGFIPRTYCGQKVGELSAHANHGDRDPLDICVISERQISRAEMILNAKVVGGIHTTDAGEADDKIIAILQNDNFWGDIIDVSELPNALVERLRHYFATYKIEPGRESPVRVYETYSRDPALAVVQAAMQDYEQAYGHHGEVIA